jgi:hypothetical protein
LSFSAHKGLCHVVLKGVSKLLAPYLNVTTALYVQESR